MSDYVIIYDDACPMCQAYTSGFVAAGILPQNGRENFSGASPEILENLDLNRARHEIPLYNRKTGETIYGYKALFTLLGEWQPLFKPLFNFKPFGWFIYGLYQIITYNRRIIAGSIAPMTGFDCAPDFHAGYRFLYIFLALLASFLLKNATFIPILSIGLVVLLPYCFMGVKKSIEYIGHLVSVVLFTQIIGFFLSFILNESIVFWVGVILFCGLLVQRIIVIHQNKLIT